VWLLCVVAVVKESNDPQSTTNKSKEAGTMRSAAYDVPVRGSTAPFAPSEYLVRKAFRRTSLLRSVPLRQTRKLPSPPAPSRTSATTAARHFLRVYYAVGAVYMCAQSFELHFSLRRRSMRLVFYRIFFCSCCGIGSSLQQTLSIVIRIIQHF
jgi:hypothetical protein